MRFLKSMVAFVAALAAGVAFAATSEITVDLKLDWNDWIVGERVRGVINIANLSLGTISVGASDSSDRLFVEVFRASTSEQLERVTDRPFVAPFFLKSNEALKLETRLADVYGLNVPGHYMARAVLVHDGVRYEGMKRAFDIVPGIFVSSTLQMFSNHPDLRRELELVTWNRSGRAHLFLTARDTGSEVRRWHATDLGEMMRLTTPPMLSVMKGGEVVVLHRYDSDNFIRSEFWSLPGEMYFFRRELVQDPETAGANRIREIYRESGGVKPKDNPWWKFW